MPLPDNLFITESESARNAMKLIDTNGYGVVFVLNNKKALKGIISSGDVRRALSEGFDINSAVVTCMNPQPLTLLEGLNPREAMSFLVSAIAQKEKEIGETILSIKLPVVNKKGQVVDVASYNQEQNQLSVSFGQDSLPKTKTIKKVLLVGGAGYLGSVLARTLLGRGYSVRVLDSLVFGRKSIEDLLPLPGFELIVGDIRDIQTLYQSLAGVDAVIHLAAIVGDPAGQKTPSDTIGVNYLASVTLALACKYYQINRFIYASTCSVYGIGANELDESAPLNPVSLYARTKIESEKGILSLTDSNFKPIIMRMSTLYGLSPRMRFDLVINTFAKLATTQHKIEIFGGDQWRPFIHVADAADAYVKMLETPLSDINTPIFNVGTNGQNHTIKEIGELVKKVLPKTKVVIKKSNDHQGQDKRTYKVLFNKLANTVGFKAKYSIQDSITEISQAIVSGEIMNVDDAMYYNFV